MAASALLAVAPAASAATRTVDDDKAQCPAAAYTSIQAAIDAASNGDVITVCPGTYVEGTGGTDTNALTIANLSLDIRGAGADLVAIQPKRSTPTGGRIADTDLDLRNGVGDIVSISGTKAFPVTVNLSGVTIDGNGVYVEAGIVYRDGGGTVSRARVTNVVTSEADAAGSLDGGYRADFPGVGIAQVTAGSGTPALARPALEIVQSRIERYNRVGVLIDAATNDTPPLIASTVVNEGRLVGDQIVGRTQCSAFNTPTAPPYVLGGAGATNALELPGNCATVSLTGTGTTFGQDGVRVTAGSTVAITDTTISGNLVHGTGAPTYNSATNNANLVLGAGVRLIGAGVSSIQRSNLIDNAYGVVNVQLDGTTANTVVPLSAENNFWGLRTNATGNFGPAVSPTTNPPYQENAVNGTATVDATCVTSVGHAGPGSDAVDFCPFRNGNQGDPNLGELPVAYAPLPVPDDGPAVTLAAGVATYERGDTVTLTATASDDFGVAKVTFYDGASQVGTAIPPAVATTFAIPADAPCAARTLTAVAEDSAGQTASDTETITVVEARNCIPPDPTPMPPDPTPVPPDPTPVPPRRAADGRADRRPGHGPGGRSHHRRPRDGGPGARPECGRVPARDALRLPRHAAAVQLRAAAHRRRGRDPIGAGRRAGFGRPVRGRLGQHDGGEVRDQGDSPQGQEAQARPHAHRDRVLQRPRDQTPGLRDRHGHAHRAQERSQGARAQADPAPARLHVRAQVHRGRRCPEDHRELRRQRGPQSGQDDQEVQLTWPLA